jgi:hypothetical protein
MKTLAAILDIRRDRSTLSEGMIFSPDGVGFSLLSTFALLSMATGQLILSIETLH